MNPYDQRVRIIKEVIKPYFKRINFGVSGTTFLRSEKDLIQVFNIQSSAWNDETSVSFYLNIGIYFPIWNELSGIKHPNHLKEYDCQYRIRTDALTGRNQCYDIHKETDIEEFESLIRGDVSNYILPFFEKFRDIESCLQLPEPFLKTDLRPYIGLTLIKNGKSELGNKILDEYLSEPSNLNKQVKTLRGNL